MSRSARRWIILLLIGLGVFAGYWFGLVRESGFTPASSVRREDIVAIQPLRAGHAAVAPVESRGSNQPGSGSGQVPRALLPEAFYDFGLIGADQIVQKEFFLTNSGEGALVIQQAYTTCSCTTADLSSAVIPPGKSSRITIVFDPSVHDVSGTTVRRGLILETNDPSNPSLEIWVQATVRN